MESIRRRETLDLSATRQQVSFRAGAALGLMVLFYVLAFLVVAALGVGGYLALVGLGGVGALLVGGTCAAAAVVVLGAMIPRNERFVAPGPELARATHAALFREVQQLAEDTRQKMPDRIYLLNDVNAFVADHGGVLGLGSRRVLGIGLPLLCALDRQELRSVLGHEFGHFCASDTRVGPWVYRGRRAMITAAQNLGAVARALGAVGFVFKLLAVPFTAYATRYLRFTQDLSRRQELAADEVGAKLAGTASTVSALRAVEVCSVAFQVYFRNELVPLIQVGCLAPVAEGFRRFLKTATARRLIEQVQAEPDKKADALDSHPSLAERVFALQAVAGPRRGRDDRPAADLLHELPGYELALVKGMLEGSPELKPVTWKEVGKVLADQWHRIGSDVAVAFRPRTFAELPVDPKEHRVLLGLYSGKDVSGVSDEEVQDWARWALMHLVFAGLLTAGLRCESMPGEPVRFSSDRQQFEAAEVVYRLLRGAMNREDWRTFCRDTGLLRVDVEMLAAHSPRFEAERALAEA